MSKSDILAGRAYVSLFVKGSEFSKGLKAAQSDLNAFGSSIVGIGAKVAGMGAGIVGSLAGAVVQFSNVGDALDKMSLRTGVSASALSELGFAAEQSGTTIEEVEGAFKKMAKNLGEIGPESIKVTAALQELGLTTDMIAGLAPEDQFSMIAERIAEIQDPTKKAAAAMAIFGESGRQLIPMLNDVKALRKEAKDLGLSPSPENVKAAAEINDAIGRVRRVIGAAIFEIGAALAPMALDVLAAFLKVVSAIRKFIVENKSLVITAAKVGAVLLAVGSAVVAVGTGIIALGAVFGGMASILATVSTAIGAVLSLLSIVLSPVGILIAALTAGVYAWVRFSDAGKSAAGGLLTAISETFGKISKTASDTIGGIVAAFKAGDLKLAGQIAITGLRLVFAQGLQAVYGLFGGTVGKIVDLFFNAANMIRTKWQETINAIADFILEQASGGGVMGWALEKVSGVNMQEEVARGKRIEAERIAKGMKADGGIVDSAQMQADAAMKSKLSNVAGDQADQVKALQDELDALVASAKTKAEEIKNDGGGIDPGLGLKNEQTRGGDSGSGKASVASFSLAALSQIAARDPNAKTVAELKEQKKLQQKANELAQQIVDATKGGGLVFA